MYNKITMALECCIKQEMNCKDCPYEEHRHRDCIDRFYVDVINFFNRQKAEIERLTKCRKEEVEKLMLATDRVITEAKSEAYKEFAERLKYKRVFLEDDERYFGYAVKEEDIDDTLKELMEKGNEGK